MDNLRCPQCGSPNTVQVDIDRYECPYCGTSFNLQEASQAQAVVKKIVEQQKKSNDRSEKSIIILTVLFVVLSLLAIGGYVFYVLNEDEHSTEMTEDKKKQNYLPDTNKNIEEEKGPEDLAKEAYELVNSESHDKIEKKYCTRDWNNLMARYDKLSENLGEELMGSGCEYYDSWIEGQDPGDLYEVIESIRYKEIEPNKVWVKVKLQGFYIVDGEKIVGPLQSTILVMKKEDNEWKIDDLRHEFEGQFYSIKDGMENCLKEYGY